MIVNTLDCTSDKVNQISREQNKMFSQSREKRRRILVSDFRTKLNFIDPKLQLSNNWLNPFPRF